MLPTINGKSFLDCIEEDLKELLGNTAYREDEHIDYKEAFTIDSYPKGDSRRDKAIAELRSDICAFANADGGYLLFGIQEDGEGVAKELVGVTVQNKDKYEMNLNNWLQSVLPRIPTYKTAFIPLTNEKYVVVIAIENDYFAPYIHLVDERDYRIYKRNGNSKRTIPYTELKNMFVQSISLEKEIEKYRRERVECYLEGNTMHIKYASIFVFHIIPDSFMDRSYDIPLFILQRKGTDFSGMFREFDCNHISFPIVEGLRFKSYQAADECRLFNNGVAEVKYDIERKLHRTSDDYPNGYYPWAYVWNKIEDTIKAYAKTMGRLISTHRVYAGFSLIGCTDVMSHRGNFSDENAYIDRHKLYMNTMTFEDITDEDTLSIDLKKMKLDYMLSLGISTGDDLRSLIDELYDVN